MTDHHKPNCRYMERDYDSKERFCSYWHQIDEVLSSRPNTLLEIGVGNGFVGAYLAERGVGVTSLDIEDRLSPDVVGTVCRLPFKDDSFEKVLCCEVLEHIPFESFGTALSEIRRIASKDAVISLPVCMSVRKWGKNTVLNCSLLCVLSIPRKSRLHTASDQEHFWEVDSSRWTVRNVSREIERRGWTIVKRYRVPENPFHMFFVLHKRKT